MWYKFLMICMLFFNSCQSIIKPKTIAIQPFEDVDTILLNSIAQQLEEKYHCKTIIFQKKDLPANCYYQPRNRYRADKLIAFLKENKPKTAQYILGVTNKDISTTVHNHIDFGIFGLGYCPGKSCIVSTFRIQHKKNTVFKERLFKISLHEIGHNFGLKHCKDKNCLMTDAEKSIKTIDNAKLNLCEKCFNLIS